MAKKSSKQSKQTKSKNDQKNLESSIKSELIPLSTTGESLKLEIEENLKLEKEPLNASGDNSESKDVVSTTDSDPRDQIEVKNGDIIEVQATSSQSDEEKRVDSILTSIDSLKLNTALTQLESSELGGDLKLDESSEQVVNSPVQVNSNFNQPSEVVNSRESSEVVNPKLNQSTESIGETTPLADTKPKKRLTLQERLALAAKGKNKSKEASITPSSSVPQSNQNSNLSSPKINPVDEPVQIDPIQNEASAQLKKKVLQLESENQKLAEKLKIIEPVSKNSDILKTLATKDETIQQLMREGEALSIKELKLNESIKKLKSKISDLESNLSDYSDKSDSTERKLGELDYFLRENGFKNLDQLKLKFNESSNQIVQLKKSQKEDDIWEKKYTDQKSILDKELTRNKALGTELSDVKVSLELIKQKHDLEIDSKNNIILDLKHELSSARQQSRDEVSRLEVKIESLRLVKESGQDAVSTDTESKSGDMNEFTKLSENHHNLQQQYLSSQENWKLIESNLLGKIDTLSNNLDSLKKNKLKTAGEIKKFNGALNELSIKNNNLEQQIIALKDEKDQLNLTLEFKDNDLNELKEKSKTFKNIFNNEKQNLESKIKSLQETIDNLNERPDALSPRGSLSRLHSSDLHLALDASDPYTQDFGSPGWEIKLGESSITPRVSSSHLYYDGLRRHSLNSITEDGRGSDRETIAEDDFSNASHQPSFNRSFGNTNGGDNRNLQLLNKLSATSRRLEVEINTLKEENTQLQTEKEHLQLSLSEKYKLEKEVDALKGEIEAINIVLQNKDDQQQTMLELIGEKSEQVEELKADVQDLKDLCRQQVQQMVGLE